MAFTIPSAAFAPSLSTGAAAAHRYSGADFSRPAVSLIETVPSSLIADSAEGARVFEAVAPDSSLLIGFGAVVLICAVAGYVWAEEVVPVSRTKLALSKRSGDVKEYLDELRDAGETGEAANSEATSMPMAGEEQSPATTETRNGREFERWLFSDWLNKPAGKGGRQKEPALPILTSAKWNSGDNPVLVTALIMLVGVVVASVTERVATL